MVGLPASAKGVFAVALGDLDGDGWDDLAAAVNEPADGGDLANLLFLSEPAAP
jgi:hypothetical protein